MPNPCDNAGALIVRGKLIDYFETGLEGVVWGVLEADSPLAWPIHFIEEGDHLAIFDRGGRELWSGLIVCDRTTEKIPRPTNPKFSQQAALTHWIHWVQAGFEPDAWAEFFIRPENDRLSGVLKKTNKT